MKKLLTKRAKSWERALSLFSRSESSFHSDSSLCHKDRVVKRNNKKCDALAPKRVMNETASAFSADCADAFLAPASPYQGGEFTGFCSFCWAPCACATESDQPLLCRACLTVGMTSQAAEALLELGSLSSSSASSSSSSSSESQDVIPPQAPFFEQQFSQDQTTLMTKAPTTTAF